jgi:Cys-tRNA(Pro)/Cys-tRNA(Cys) deacylase
LTPAVQYLKKCGIAHKIAEYDHLEKGAVFAARAIDFPLESTIKTLIIELIPGGFCIVLMPGSKKISFKKLAKTQGAKKATMVDARTAERLSGYLIGGISPFGFKQRLPVLMDAGLLDFGEVAINGGRRGVMLIMTPSDIAASTSAKLIPM